MQGSEDVCRSECLEWIYFHLICLNIIMENRIAYIRVLGGIYYKFHMLEDNRGGAIRGTLLQMVPTLVL